MGRGHMPDVQNKPRPVMGGVVTTRLRVIGTAGVSDVVFARLKAESLTMRVGTHGLDRSIKLRFDLRLDLMSHCSWLCEYTVFRYARGA